MKFLNISNFVTNNVKDMYQMFNYCYSLTSIHFSHFNGLRIKDDDLFDYFPPFGTIKVNEKFVKEIEKKLPRWTIIPAN